MQIAWKYNGDKEIELHWHGYSSTIQGTNNILQALVSIVPGYGAQRLDNYPAERCKNIYRFSHRKPKFQMD
mgnify:CR=1 FL=1